MIYVQRPKLYLLDWIITSNKPSLEAEDAPANYLVGDSGGTLNLDQ